ncbi:hypothetical protein F511_03665 [Dorcoceras hygrometricum]|uniref:Uncharacterized protein n=1 Tax=Dorcoceras hygrometricum TaxID=472368 RepID=A0A2Z7BDF3_9LAMI|nr:hypothetical protein F511_03665 [Dorcoceras hygrometricum]
MNWGRVSFDASAYMLFEATGDSEAECVDVATGDASEVESEDDALSCSDGSPPDCADVHLEVDAADGGRVGFNCGEYDNVGDGFGSRQEDRGEHCGDEDEDDGVVDQYCGGPAEVEPTGDAKDDMEDSSGGRESDRLFWEACLQS